MIKDDITSSLASECGGKTIFNRISSDTRFIYPFNCGVMDVPYGGGIHSGKIYEIFGEESNGKTTAALEITKAVTNYYDSINEDNYAVLWIESESALDRQRAMYIGCKLNKFVFEEAETVEDARDYMIDYLKRCVDKKLRLLIVWDTLASASTRNEMKAALSSNEKEKYNSGMMEKPRLISEMLRTVTNLLGKTDSTLILVNQVRMKPGQFASTLEPPGGKGVRFHSSARTFVKKVAEVYSVLQNKSKRMVAIESELFHVKNKLTSPKQVSTVYISTERGINKLETTVRHLKGIEDGPIRAKGGGHFAFNMPDTIATVDGDSVSVGKMVEISFQKVDKLEKLIETYKHLYKWLDYLVYNNFANSTVLVKVMVMDKLWEYEVLFFGKKITELSDEEEILYNADNEMESSDTKVIEPKKKVVPKSKAKTKKK